MLLPGAVGASPAPAAAAEGTRSRTLAGQVHFEVINVSAQQPFMGIA